MDKQIIDKIGWIYLKDKKLLAVRAKGKEVFYIPGGKRESGETDKQALTREIKEETSVDLIPQSLRFLEKFEAPAHGKTDMSVQISAYTGDFIGELAPDSEIDEIGWLNYKDKETATPVMKLILEYLKDLSLID
ncbi:MAG: NUDIX domain-containing protein [Candidatus Paceibacterota bacterium]